MSIEVKSSRNFIIPIESMLSWRTCKTLIGLLVVLVFLQIGLKTSLVAISLDKQLLALLTGGVYSLILLAGFLLSASIIWFATNWIVERLKSAIASAPNQREFFEDFASLISTIIRSILRAPRKFLFWLAGGNGGILYMRWSRVKQSSTIDSTKEVTLLGKTPNFSSPFSQTAMKTENVGLVLLTIGVYIFGATAYLLSLMVQPEVSIATSSKLSVSEYPTKKTSPITKEASPLTVTKIISSATVAVISKSPIATDGIAPNDAPIGASNSLLKKIPIVGDYLVKAIGSLPDAVIFIAALLAISVVLADRSIYVDKGVENWIWDRRKNDSLPSNNEKPDGSKTVPANNMLTNAFNWLMDAFDWVLLSVKVIAKYSPRLVLAIGLSYIGATAGELYFFQKDIDAKLAIEFKEKLEEIKINDAGQAKYVLIEEEKEVKKAERNFNTAFAKHKQLEASLNSERMPKVEGEKVTFYVCVPSSLQDESSSFANPEIVQIKGLTPQPCKEGFKEHPLVRSVSTSGTSGIGKFANIAAAELKQALDDVTATTAFLRTSQQNLIEKRAAFENESINSAHQQLGSSGFLKRLGTLEKIKEDHEDEYGSGEEAARWDFFSENPLRKLSAILVITLLMFELLPLSIKVFDIIFFYRVSAHDWMLYAIEKAYIDALISSNGATELEDEKEGSEKLFDSLLHFIEKRIPELLPPIAGLLLVFWISSLLGSDFATGLTSWLKDVIKPLDLI